jgi:hypothetical protein
MHSQKHCCASISIVSYSPAKYNQARQHLDDKIALLQWIVGQFVLVPCDHLHRQHQVCVAWFVSLRRSPRTSIQFENDSNSRSSQGLCLFVL